MQASRRPLIALLMLLMVYVLGYGVLRSQDVLQHQDEAPTRLRFCPVRNEWLIKLHNHSIIPGMTICDDDWQSRLADQIATPAAQLYMPLCWCEARVWEMLEHSP